MQKFIGPYYETEEYYCVITGKDTVQVIFKDKSMIFDYTVGINTKIETYKFHRSLCKQVAEIDVDIDDKYIMVTPIIYTYQYIEFIFNLMDNNTNKGE